MSEVPPLPRPTDRVRLGERVAEAFADEVYLVSYVAVMVILGFHLRHGFWSAFQSLGGHHPRYTPVIYGIGVVFAVLLALGFLVIPVWFYFGGAA